MDLVRKVCEEVCSRANKPKSYTILENTFQDLANVLEEDNREILSAEYFSTTP